MLISCLSVGHVSDLRLPSPRLTSHRETLHRFWTRLRATMPLMMGGNTSAAYAQALACTSALRQITPGIGSTIHANAAPRTTAADPATRAETGPPTGVAIPSRFSIRSAWPRQLAAMTAIITQTAIHRATGSARAARINCWVSRPPARVHSTITRSPEILLITTATTLCTMRKLPHGQPIYTDALASVPRLSMSRRTIARVHSPKPQRASGVVCEFGSLTRHTICIGMIT